MIEAFRALRQHVRAASEKPQEISERKMHSAIFVSGMRKMRGMQT